MASTPLPIDTVLDTVVEALGSAGAVALQAAPGAGKTTRVPVALSRAGLARGRRVVVLQPRRVAARAAARRIAAEQGWRVGEEVGYHVRFDRRMGERSGLVVVTEGIFLAELQRDPLLDEIGVVVFDEFHERRLDQDLALAMARLVQREVRPDLGLVVMSATLDVEPVARFLGGCPVVSCEVRHHPVELRYPPRPVEGDPALAAARAVSGVLAEAPGDVLVFLPGMAWIERCARALAATVGEECELHRLHGSLKAADQDRALERSSRRKVILATNIAETSLTIDGVAAVVDTGLARVLRYDRGCGLNRLETVRIGRASAEQRAGRAGRQGPGLCWRLWTELEDRALRPAESPEIARLELSGALLQLLAWGESDPRAFPWFEPPATTRVDEAMDLLRDLGAVEGGRLTEVGRRMAGLPLSPRLARMLVEAEALGCLPPATLVAAVLGEGAEPPGPDLAAWAFSAGRGRWPESVERARDQLLRLAGHPDRDTAGDPESLARALLTAFPDRLARRRPGDRSRAVMAGGRGVRLPEGLMGGDGELVVAVGVSAGSRGRHSEGWVTQALAVAESWLPRGSVAEAVEVELDAGRVRAWRRRRWLDLVIGEREEVPDPERAAEILAEAAAAAPEAALGLDRPEVASFVARVRSLAGWRPELGLPTFSRRELEELLPGLCQGKRALAELRRLPMGEILRGGLSRDQQVALERQAPERMEVPSGSRLRLTYEPGRPPVLAVRLQELFGLRETPTVAGGRVKVLLHLLAPNGRPQQVTDDLASFWATTYPQVRGELRGRYPKHAWPEDPTTAEPLRGARRRRL